MAVSGTVRPTINPWALSQDLRYPQARWFWQHNLLGDVSGGGATSKAQWSTDVPNALFSLEQVSVKIQGTTTAQQVFGLYICAMKTNDNNNWNYQFKIDCQGNSGQNEISGTQEVKSLIVVPNVVGTNLECQITSINPGAGNNLVVNGWGYVWDIKALQFSGGPVRPGEYVVS